MKKKSLVIWMYLMATALNTFSCIKDSFFFKNKLLVQIIVAFNTTGKIEWLWV